MSGVRTNVVSNATSLGRGCPYLEEYVELVTYFDGTLYTYAYMKDFTSFRGSVLQIRRVAAFAKGPYARWIPPPVVEALRR